MDRRVLLLEKKQEKNNIAEFTPGDTVTVSVRVTEGNKERIQKFTGTVLAVHGSGLRKTVTVRKVSWGIGIERVFLVHSPKVAGIQLERRGKVRRSRLFYLRDRSAKGSRIEEDRKAAERDQEQAAIEARDEIESKMHASEKEEPAEAEAEAAPEGSAPAAEAEEKPSEGPSDKQ